jgi:signal transduction histidine kinase
VQSAQAQPRIVHNVLTIHSGAVDYLPNPVLDAAIRKALIVRRGESIDYFTEYLEFDRFSQGETSRALGDYIGRKYRGRRIDLVIAMTNRALQFVLEHRARLFPNAAIVCAAIGVSDDDLLRLGAGRVTGVRVGSAYAESLKLALQLHPGTRQVYVVAISPNRANEQSVRAELRPLERQVSIKYFAAESTRELLTAVQAVPRGSLILYIWYQRPGADYISDPQEPARLVAAAAAVPVYGVIDANVGTGIVGGMVRDTRGTGARVGEMARKVLDGVAPRSIAIEYAPVLPVFDWRQLRRWGLDEDRLPAGADVRFRQPTMWEAYGGFMLAAFVVMAAQLALIAALLTQRARRRRVETMLQARETTLKASFRRIRRMAGHLIHAQETARAEVARDLHDDVCQGLVAISMTVSSLKRSTASVQAPRTQQTLSQLEKAVLDTVESVRRLSHDLHPASLRLIGLVAALKGHCVEVEKHHEVQVSFKARGDLTELPPEVSAALFRIAQESLRNGIVHGSARQLAVSVARSNGFIDMTVADDGHGFDLASVRRNASGLGLVSIEERAHVVGGRAEIITQRSGGTTIYVRVPAAGRRTTDTEEVPPVRPLPLADDSPMARLTRALRALKREGSRSIAIVSTSRVLGRPADGAPLDPAVPITPHPSSPGPQRSVEPS